MAEGVTATLVPLTVPTPGAMARLVAPLTVQERTLAPPGEIVVGAAVKERMTGRAGVTSCSAPLKQPEVPSASASAATRPAVRYDRGACIIPPE